MFMVMRVLPLVKADTDDLVGVVPVFRTEGAAEAWIGDGTSEIVKVLWKEEETVDDTELVEKLADAEHASWSRWMDYLFSICEKTPAGSVIIPPRLVERWKRQAATRYQDLTDREKQSDRDEVARILPIIKEWKRSE